MDIHKENLKHLCCICGILLSRRKSGFHNVSEYSTRIERAFRQEVSLDHDDIHPNKFCYTCYKLKL